MTEAEWLTRPAVWHLVGRTSDRKLRLFACACARLLIEAVTKREGMPHLWRWVSSTEVERLVAVVALGEALSDGIAVVEELNAARADPTQVPRNLHHSVCDPREYANKAAYGTLNEIAFDAAGGAMGCVHLGFGELNDKEPFGTGPAFDFDVDSPLLRDIFGNPFRPVTFSPAWRTDTAVVTRPADVRVPRLLRDADSGRRASGRRAATATTSSTTAATTRHARPRVLGGRSGAREGVTVPFALSICSISVTTNAGTSPGVRFVITLPAPHFLRSTEVPLAVAPRVTSEPL